jgi:hypothetical protein
MGANWKTTISSMGTLFFGILTFLSTVSYDQGPIAMVIPIKFKPYVATIAGVSALGLWCWNGIRQKDKDVTGGVVQQTASGAVADPGTQTLVDETIKATIKSGEPVSAEQKAAAQL